VIGRQRNLHVARRSGDDRLRRCRYRI
jgi:hypothetical protein